LFYAGNNTVEAFCRKFMAMIRAIGDFVKNHLRKAEVR
jgi:hypothetical protein